MRLSHLFFASLRDDPAEAEMASHRLLVRAGYVRQLGAGIYTLLPLGFRVQQRIPLGGRRSIDGIAEIFNVFNRPNWGIGTQESTTSQYLQHITAQVRTAQFGFRLTF